MSVPFRGARSLRAPYPLAVYRRDVAGYISDAILRQRPLDAAARERWYIHVIRLQSQGKLTQKETESLLRQIAGVNSIRTAPRKHRKYGKRRSY
jgi:hypothetical protein